MRLKEFDQASANSKQITTKLKQLGYTMLGSGTDASVWTKDEATVIKILMPEGGDYGGTDRAETNFLTFYNFCQQHKGNPNLPKFIDIGGAHHSVFEINGVPYRQIAMERLQPINNNSFEQAMVWALSELASVAFIKWNDVLKQIFNNEFWNDFGGKWNSTNIKQTLTANPALIAQYKALFITMQGLYNAGKQAGVGWDLHTENAMQRKDGTIVISDPYFG